MRRYYYYLYDMWLTCFAKSKAQAMDKLENQPDIILTEREALRRAQNGDDELASYIQSSYLCDLMCN